MASFAGRGSTSARSCSRGRRRLPAGRTVLLSVHGSTPDDAAERELHGSIALGDERTIQQDPAFALRIMVDIAIRALSPAVNDPTTASQVINHLGETLRQIGSTDLEPAGDQMSDGPGVVMQVRRWEDFLALGVTEIREYGATSVQVMRRSRAMLDELGEEVLPEHRAAVLDEIVRLDATVAEHWSRSGDLDRASVADRKGSAVRRRGRRRAADDGAVARPRRGDHPARRSG